MTGSASDVPRRWRKAALVDRVFVLLLALYSLYALGWLVLGLGIGAVANVSTLHQWVNTWQATAPPGSAGERIAHGLQIGVMHSEPAIQVAFDYLFSMLNVGLSVVLLRAAPKDWTARLLAVGMIGSSGAFNLQAHADTYAVRDAFGLDIGFWHTALLHGVGGVCYVFALLMFPSGRFEFGRRNRWIVRGLLLAIVGGTIGLLSVSTASYAHPVSFVVFFGLLVPVAGVAAQLRRYAAATNAESRQQSRVLVWALCLAFGAAAAMTGLTVIAVAVDSGTTFESSDSLFFWVCRAVFTMIPCALLVGVLRFRLWDVELLFNRTFIYGVLSLMIGGLYIGVVVVADWLLRPQDNANLPVRLLAAAVVVLALRPAQKRISTLANRLVYGRRPPPYDVLASLATLSHATVDGTTVLPSLARATAEGLNVARCEVRLHLHDGTDQHYLWPPGSQPLSSAHTVAVSYGGERVGEFRIDQASAVRLAPEQQRLLGDLAHGAGLVMDTARLTVELQHRLAQISAHAIEITASRRRITHEQETERRALERNLHDGAQPRLVAIRMSIGLLAHLIDTDGTADAIALIEALDTQLTETDADMAELSTGLYPPLLRESGFLAALRAQTDRLGIDASFDMPADLPRTQLSSETEAAVCLAAMEALQNAAKHAPGAPVRVTVWPAGDQLLFSIRDDGPGFVVVDQHGGVGLQSMADRIAAVGGRVRIESMPDRGTTVIGQVPIRDDPADLTATVVLPRLRG